MQINKLSIACELDYMQIEQPATYIDGVCIHLCLCGKCSKNNLCIKTCRQPVAILSASLATCLSVCLSAHLDTYYKPTSAIQCMGLQLVSQSVMCACYHRYECT